MTDEQKQESLRQMLSTPEGRAKIAAAMVSPTRCPGMSYDEKGRRYWLRGTVRHYVTDGP